MTTMNATQLSTRRLHAPRENRSVVVQPPWNEVPPALEDNLAANSAWEYDFQGKSSRQLVAEARAELRAAALGWWNAYGDRRPPFDVERPILLAGHQPQMFHPGVWLKNFALGRLADRRAATAVNLIIDSDVAASPRLLLPTGSAASPGRESVAYDRPDPIVPYEERRVEDRGLFESFAARAAAKISPLVAHPLLEKYWPMVAARSRTHGLLGASLAQARHLLESSWDCSTWEVPQSAVCDQPAFFRFTAHLLAQLPQFLPIYNAAVGEYRRRNRIRNHAHPVPDLAVEGDWREAPFWVWTADNPRRRRLFVRTAGRETTISDRQRFETKLSLSPEGDGGRAAEQLAELRRSGVKIRSRALITTLWARLVLSDLFIHGIGGGHYDQVTDTIIERFFGHAPPHFMVLSATLHLPIERQQTPAEDPALLAAKLRELTYHPERFLDHLKDKSESNSSPSALIAEKLGWIETSQTRENAKRRCRGIRGVNQRLQPWLADLRGQYQRRHDAAAAETRKNKILQWREYAFCLYPEETIREFFDGVLADIS
jgi:hypothetical protein